MRKFAGDSSGWRADSGATGFAAWLWEDLPQRFEGRVLPVDLAIAQEWGVTIEKARSRGISLSVMDGFLAATAHNRKLTLVTRNTRDFRELGMPLFDPWAE